MSLLKHLQQLRMHLLQVITDRGQTRQQNSIRLAESQKDLRARCGELAVPEIRNLGVVNPAEVQGLGQSREHFV